MPRSAVPGSPDAATQLAAPLAAGPTRTPFLPLANTPTLTLTAAPTPTPTSTVTPIPLPGLWPAPYLPEAIRDSLVLPAGFGLVAAPEQALLRLEVGDLFPLSRWVYALVAPFPTLVDGVAAQDLRRSWNGEQAGPFGGRPLLMDESTQGVFAAWWGQPAPGAVQVLPSGELLAYAWDNRPAWAILPFEALEPRWKVLEVDGRSPLWKEFDSQGYALTVPFSLNGQAGQAEEILAQVSAQGIDNLGVPALNRDPAKLTTLAMTGVTALVRATAFTMHRNGVLYPGQDVRAILREADFTHISNEIPFTPDCPPPNPQQEGLRFCSHPGYIELLEDIGADIVELTGDHFGDWGPDAMRYTLDMYVQRGWVYYGGGYNREDARQARLLEHNGNQLAFIGCNAKGGGYATASDNNPGAVSCDFAWMHNEITRLRQQGYQVIATFQHFEYYTYLAQPNQVADSRSMVAAGAVVVSGSQAHQPQGMEFHLDGFIHYGLGNLFFDQYQFCTDFACDDAFIDRHVFYDGRYLSTELLTIRFIDFARPRPMTPEEREILLQKVFSASGW